jgi:hypothetical protein
MKLGKVAGNVRNHLCETPSESTTRKGVHGTGRAIIVCRDQCGHASCGRPVLAPARSRRSLSPTKRPCLRSRRGEDRTVRSMRALPFCLEVRVPEAVYVIEQAPIRPSDGAERGVVAERAVGAQAAGRLKLFRYEIRCWRDGVIPDIDEAVDSPQRLTNDLRLAQRVLEAVRAVPTPVWGRMSCAQGKCGTPIRSLRGSSCAAALTSGCRHT